MTSSTTIIPATTQVEVPGTEPTQQESVQSQAVQTEATQTDNQTANQTQTPLSETAPDETAPDAAGPNEAGPTEATPTETVLGEEATAAKRPVDKRTEKEKLQNAIHGTSYKDQPTLLALKKRLERLSESHTSESQTSESQNSPAEDPAELAALAAVLDQRLTEYDSWQQKLVQEIDTAITEVGSRIADGRVTEAQSLLDRTQSQLRKINADEQTRLQTLMTPLREQLVKLLDWKKFASSEKKKELIEKMQALSDDSTQPEPAHQPAQKAKLIRALQDEWKTLGHSDDNDGLWTQFSELARVAFEPCKVYFKERKEKQAGNLVARNNICEQLEAYAGTLENADENQNVNLNELTRLENQAREDWKKYAPVAQNKINALQSRFNAVLNQLRVYRRQAMQSHNAAKQALIEQAQALVTQDDLTAAIQQAKTLQQEWKDLGPGSFKDDRKLWAEFRAACDALFARREDISKEKRQARPAASASSQAVRDVLKQISALLSLDDEAFTEARPRFNALSAEFREALTPELKHERKPLQEQFNKLSRQIDVRLRATPDRKTLQLLQQVQAQAAFCQQREESLLAPSPTQSELTESPEELEQAWQALEKVSDDTLEQTLKKRFRQLLQHVGEPSSAASALAAAAEKTEQRGRELCVEAEIMLGADTPAADKAIRMQQQLNQLQRGLGRIPPSQKEKIQGLQNMEMQLLAMGPLQPVTRSSLQNRLQQLRQKL